MTLQEPLSSQGAEKDTEAQSSDVIEPHMGETARDRLPPSDPLLPVSNYAGDFLWFSSFPAVHYRGSNS